MVYSPTNGSRPGSGGSSGSGGSDDGTGEYVSVEDSGDIQVVIMCHLGILAIRPLGITIHR